MAGERFIGHRRRSSLSRFLCGVSGDAVIDAEATLALPQLDPEEEEKVVPFSAPEPLIIPSVVSDRQAEPLAPAMANPQQFHAGDPVQLRRTTGKWVNARIKEVIGSDRVIVEYEDQGRKFNKKIRTDSVSLKFGHEEEEPSEESPPLKTEGLKPLTLEESLSKVEDALKCTVCWELPDKSRILLCGHVLCKSCLVQIRTNSCPVCRSEFSKPIQCWAFDEAIRALKRRSSA